MQTLRIGLAGACGLMLAAGVMGQEQSHARAERARGARVGEAAPDFTLTDHTGKQHKLSDYRDQVVVLEWVNQQCPWCVRSIPFTRAMQQKYSDKGVVWLGVESTHWRTPQENVEWAKENKLEFPILMDNNGAVGRQYGAKTTPQVFVIDKGKLVYRGAPHNDRYGRKNKSEVRNYLEEALQAVLAGKPVPLAETKSWGCSVKYQKPGDEKKPGRKGK